MLHDSLGLRCYTYSAGQKLRWPGNGPLLSWLCRGTFLPRSALHPFVVLYAQGDRYSSIDFIRWYVFISRKPPDAFDFIAIHDQPLKSFGLLADQTAGNIFAVSFAGLIAAATFATLDDKHGMHGWQW